MATRLIGSKSRLVAYMPNIGSMVKHFRSFCSYDGHQSVPAPVIDSKVLDSMSEERGDDGHLGPLLPTDGRFPMPGMTNTYTAFEQQQHRLNLRTNAYDPFAPLPDVFTAKLPQERQAEALSQFVVPTDLESTEEIEASLMVNEPTPLDFLECQAVNCPQAIRKDFQELFPNRDFSKENLTVITISQQTQQNMSGWSNDVEEEREQLLEKFISGANEICEALHEAGFWADFVDPSSGLPYLTDHTNDTLFETDERYRNLGFEIDDLGCCKVVRHHLWGNNAYVGSLFTNAPLDHPVMKSLVKK